jgi:hypothetical protein
MSRTHARLARLAGISRTHARLARLAADDADRARHLDAARRTGGDAGESGIPGADGVAAGADDAEAALEDDSTRRRWRRRR